MLIPTYTFKSFLSNRQYLHYVSYWYMKQKMFFKGLLRAAKGYIHSPIFSFRRIVYSELYSMALLLGRQRICLLCNEGGFNQAMLGTRVNLSICQFLTFLQGLLIDSSIEFKGVKSSNQCLQHKHQGRCHKSQTSKISAPPRRNCYQLFFSILPFLFMVMALRIATTLAMQQNH